MTPRKPRTADPAVDGRVTEYHANGVVSGAGRMRGGRRAGVWTFWRDNGTPRSRGKFRRGEPHGAWTFWHDTGHVESVGEYADGAHVGTWQYHDPDGVLESSVEYVAGKRHGVSIEFWRDGSVRSEHHYRGDQLHGAVRAWYPSGARLLRGRYERGQRHGAWWFWHPDGSPDRRGKFHGGRLVGEWNHFDLQGNQRTVVRREHVVLADARDHSFDWLCDPVSPRAKKWLASRRAEAERVIGRAALREQLVAKDFEVGVGDGDLRRELELAGGRRFSSRWLAGTNFSQVTVQPATERGIARERVLLDLQRESRGKPGYRCIDCQVNAAGSLLAWTSDERGDERLALRVLRVPSGSRLKTRFPKVADTPIWMRDDRTLLIVQSGPAFDSPGIAAIDVLTGTQTWLCHFASPTWTQSRLSSSGRYAMFWTGEGTHLVDLATAEPSAVQVGGSAWPEARRLDHAPGRGRGALYRINADHGLDVAVDGTVREPKWSQVLAPEPGVELHDLRVTAREVLLLVNANGSRQLRSIERATGRLRRLRLPGSPGNLDFEPVTRKRKVVVKSTDLLLPVQRHELLAPDARRRQRWRQLEPVHPPVPRSRYVSARVTASSAGAEVGISVVHGKGLTLDGSAPLLLYGYGGFRHAVLPIHDRRMLRLVDAGWVLATAHVRGGDDFGARWWRAGAGVYKHSSFDDFAAAADELVAQQYTSRERLATIGYSAGGGLVLGAAVRRPDMCAAVIARYPTGSPIDTMLDDTLRYGSHWRDDYGDMDDPIQYQLAKAWSPFDALRPAEYPHMLVSAGVNDARVPWYEAARFVAQLRRVRSGNSMALLTASPWGHYEPDDRLVQAREHALRLAFLERALGVPVIAGD